MKQHGENQNLSHCSHLLYFLMCKNNNNRESNHFPLKGNSSDLVLHFHNVWDLRG